MATLEKIRSKGVLLLIVIGGALLAFIIGDFINSSTTFVNQSKANVAKIDGEKISLEKFLAAEEQLKEVYKIEVGETSLTEEVGEQIRLTVWENMISEKLLNTEAENIGMVVSSKELHDLILGNNISPIILSRRAFFNPETNSFDPAILAQFISTLDSENPNIPAEQLQQLKLYYTYWENMVKTQRLKEKYTALLSKAITVNSLEAKNMFDGGTTNSTVVYALKPYFTIADSLVSVSDSEIKALYKKKENQFDQEGSADIKYVTFDIKPSQEDFAEVEKWINELKSEFSTSNDVADITNSNSDVPYKGINQSRQQIDTDFRDFAFSGKTGDVMGPIFTNNTYKMARIVETGISRPDSIRIRMIYVAAENPAKTQALADSIQQAIAGGANFAALAQKYSRHEYSARNGGEFGWVKEDQLEKEISEPLFKASTNQLVQVKEYNGVQLFQIQERGANVAKVKLAVLARVVNASSRTQNNIFNQAKTFASSINTAADLETKAAQEGLSIRPAAGLNINATRIANITNARQIVKWAFEETKNTTSDVFECGDQLVVAAITNKIEKGILPLSEVKNQLRAEIAKEKKGVKIMAEMKGKSIDALAAEQYTIDTLKNVNFNTPYAGAVGNEPKLFARISMAKLNEVSAPVAGNMGVYVFTVTSQEPTNTTYNAAEEKAILNQRNQYVIPYYSIEALKKVSDIKDFRYRFF